MDCITFQKMIPVYMNKTLSDESLNEFLNHKKNCSKCSDELEVFYIVTKGMEILDEKDADYNLKAAFDRSIITADDYLKKRKSQKVFTYVIDTSVIWVLILSALIFYFRLMRN